MKNVEEMKNHGISQHIKLDERIHVEKPLFDQLDGLDWEIIDLDNKQHPGATYRDNFFLKELDLTEGRSTGISKVLKVMKENGSPPPEFETDGDRSYFLVRLPAHPKVEWNQSTSTDTKGKTSGETSGKTSGKIIELILQNASITIPEMVSKIGITERSIERNIRKLQEEDKLKRIGPAKGGHWVVKEK